MMKDDTSCIAPRTSAIEVDSSCMISYNEIKDDTSCMIS